MKRVSQLSAEEKAKAPSSLQIRNGKNKDNSNAGQYRKVIASTDDTGNGTIFVDDLKEGATYELYLTASSYLPYEPTVLWEDDEVIKITFKTLHNPNLMKSDRHIEDIKKNVPELGAAIERFIKQQEQKKEKYGRIRTYWLSPSINFIMIINYLKTWKCLDQGLLRNSSSFHFK